MFKKNEGILDRLLRATFAVILLLAGIFWLASILKWIAIIVGAILLATAVIGFCGAYTILLHKDTLAYGAKWPKWIIWLWLGLLIVLAVGGSYGSIFLTKKAFLNDYNRINNTYKQVLFQTGQGDLTEAQKELTAWQTQWFEFKHKYSAYRPWSIAFDKQFSADLETVSNLQIQSAHFINANNLSDAHLILEHVRPIFNDMLKRNSFSLFAVALVDFHDSMELVLDAANKQDASATITAYTQADKKLKDVEAIQNDQEIQDIRANLEAVKTAAQTDPAKLPDFSAKLKSSYVKVYLKRG